MTNNKRQPEMAVWPHKMKYCESMHIWGKTYDHGEHQLVNVTVTNVPNNSTAATSQIILSPELRQTALKFQQQIWVFQPT